MHSPIFTHTAMRRILDSSTHPLCQAYPFQTSLPGLWAQVVNLNGQMQHYLISWSVQLGGRLLVSFQHCPVWSAFRNCPGVGRGSTILLEVSATPTPHSQMNPSGILYNSLWTCVLPHTYVHRYVCALLYCSQSVCGKDEKEGVHM